MGKEIITEVQETQRVPNRINPRQKNPKTHINQINKDLEEIQKSQYIMNNAINEIKHSGGNK